MARTRVPPGKGPGTRYLAKNLGLGYSPGKDLGPETWQRTSDWGTPPGCGQTNKVKALPYPVLQMRAVTTKSG